MTPEKLVRIMQIIARHLEGYVFTEEEAARLEASFKLLVSIRTSSIDDT